MSCEIFSLPVLSVGMGVLSSFALLVPALRADRCLRVAASMSKLVEEAREAQDNKKQKINKTPRDGTRENILNAADNLAERSKEDAKAWTPIMSRILKFGIFAMIISNLLRLIHLC